MVSLSRASWICFATQLYGYSIPPDGIETYHAASKAGLDVETYYSCDTSIPLHFETYYACETPRRETYETYYSYEARMPSRFETYNSGEMLTSFHSANTPQSPMRATDGDDPTTFST